MTFYWYGGSGNWSDYTNHWSLNSGNVPSSPAPNAPTATDDVVFDSNSGTNFSVTQLVSDTGCNNISISGTLSTITFNGNNTYNVIKISSASSAKSLVFTAGTTTTVNYLDAWGNATYGISLNSTTTGTYNLVKANGGVVNCDYLTIAHCVATPASTWYAGTHSTNNQGVATAGSGWTFTFAPGRYWVGGSGNWDASDTTHWSTSSGGAGGASVPGTTDDVFFDRNSNATSYTVTATTSSRNCRNLIYSNPATGTLGLTGGGSYGQNIYGWMYVGPSVDWGSSNAGTVIFKATSGTNGILTNGTVCKGQFTFDGVGGTWILCDDFNITRPSSSLAFTRTNGTFNANGKTIVWTAGGTAPSVGFTGFTGTNSLYNLTLSGSSAQMVMQTVDLTITGTLKTVGTAGTRILVRSGTRGVQGIITSAINNFAYTDFEDIIGAGAGSWDVSNITGGGGDCGGNTGITFASPRNLYFYTNTSGTKLFSVVSNWYNGSGGTGGNATYYPLAQDTAIFDANSVVASTTVNMDLSSTGSINMLNVANSPNFVVTQSGAGIYGSFYAPVTSAMNTTTFTLRGRGNHILASNGQTFQCTLVIDAITGTYSLLGDITIHYSTDRALSIYSGTFNTNDYNITADNFTSSTSNTRTLNLGNSVITLTGTSGNVFSVITSTGLTLNAGTSTIRLTSASGTPALQFAGANLTFYNLEINTTPGTTVTLNGTNPVKFNRITFAPGQTVLWTAACNFSVKEFVARGTNALPISFNSTTTGTYTLTSRGGFVQADYLTIAHCVATPAYTWYAGKNSVNNQGVATAGSGWIFTDAPNAPNFSTNF